MADKFDFRFPSLRLVLVLAILLAFGVTGFTWALEIVPVPYNTSDPNIPHPTYEGGTHRFKAIARDADCGSGYWVRWDFDYDGTWDTGSTLYHADATDTIRAIEETFEFPSVSAPTVKTTLLEVQDLCSGQRFYRELFPLAAYSVRTNSTLHRPDVSSYTRMRNDPGT